MDDDGDDDEAAAAKGTLLAQRLVRVERALFVCATRIHCGKAE